jgi:hypothetical protein
VYRRGKGLIVILIHPKLLFGFKHAEERQIEGLENICCVRGKCDTFDVILTQKPEYLRSDMSTAVESLYCCIVDSASLRCRI